MKPHEQRVVDEHAALAEKLGKLHEFLETPLFEGLPANEALLLHEQADAMARYAAVLYERIQLFPKDGTVQLVGVQIDSE